MVKRFILKGGISGDCILSIALLMFSRNQWVSPERQIKPEINRAASECPQPAAERNSLIREAVENQDVIRRVEFAGNHQTPDEEISGAIVAYHSGLSLAPCYHFCAGALIVRIDKPHETHPHYILIDFRYPAGEEFPNKLIESKRLWVFRLKRTEHEDEAIEKHIKIADEKTGKEINPKLPAWNLIPGAENEEMPFGKVIPTYTLSEDVLELIRKNKR